MSSAAPLTELVVLQGVAIVLLGVLVVGLLRSHAEILRRLHDLGVGLEDPSAAEAGAPLRPRPEASLAPGGTSEDGATSDDPAATGAPAHDIVGSTPTGETAAVGIAGATSHTLLAFLSSGCLTCADFWQAFGDGGRLGLPSSVRPLIVTKSPDGESLSAVQKLAPSEVTVVMSTQAWLDYQVPGSPYFLLVDGPAARVVGEGTGDTWAQVRSLLLDAGVGQPHARPTGTRRERHDPDRRNLADAELLAAGIGPGHPSLYPEEQDEA